MTRHVRTVAIIVVLALAGTYGVFSAVTNQLATAFPRRTTLRTPAHRGLLYEDISFPASDGLTVPAWFIPANANPQSPQSPAVILVHGAAGERSMLLDVAGILHRHNYHCLLPDLRACGVHPGGRITFGPEESRDVVGAVAFLRTRPDIGPIALYGASLGGAAVIYAANSLSGEPAALVTDCTFAAWDDASTQKFGAGGTLLAATAAFDQGLIIPRPIEAIATLHLPALFIAGERDWLVNPAHSARLAQAHPGPHELWVVPGANHVIGQHLATLPLATRQEYECRLINFLNRHLQD